MGILVEEVDLQMEAQEEKVLCFLHPRQLEVDGQLTRVREVISGALRLNLGVITAEEPQDRVKEDITLHLIMMKGALQDMAQVEEEHHQVEEIELLKVQEVAHLEAGHLVVIMVTPLLCMMNSCQSLLIKIQYCCSLC